MSWLSSIFTPAQSANNFVVEFTDSDWKQEWLSIFSTQVSSVTIDLVNRYVEVSIRQLAQGYTQDLIMHLITEQFNNIDECRVAPIKPRRYEYVFTDGTLINHELAFDYDNLKAATHNLTFRFDHVRLHSEKQLTKPTIHS